VIWLLFLSCGRDEPCERTEWAIDNDGDGFGGDGRVFACARDSRVDPSLPADCDDADPERSPGHPEICNDLDDDCDGDLDEDALDAVSGFWDADGDGYGAEPATGCSPRIVPIGGDCYDVFFDGVWFHPGVDEDDCDGVDLDCDGREPPNPWMVLWPDRDLDGWSDGVGPSTTECMPDLGWTSSFGDCDDGDPLVNPNYTSYADLDGDGWGSAYGVGCAPPSVASRGDCDEADPLVHPNAEEICGDHVDQDCDGEPDDGQWWPDADGDGWGDTSAEALSRCDGPPGWTSASGDCDDADPSVSPVAAERAGDDRDDDCDGSLLVPLEADARIEAGHLLRYYDAPHALAAPDLDGDGLDELVLGETYGAAVLLGPPSDRSFAGAELLVLSRWGTPLGGLTIADLVGDATPDLVVGVPAQRAAFVFDGDRRGRLGLGEADAFLSGWIDHAVGEAVASFGEPENGSLAVLVGDDNQGEIHLIDGPLAEWTPLAESRTRIESGWDKDLLGDRDLDGDGARDLVSVTVGGAWLLTERPEGTVRIGDVARFVEATAEVGYAGDFDQDGLDDLLWTDSEPSEIHLWSPANGDEATLAWPHRIVAGAGDVDGDGVDDLVSLGPRDTLTVVPLPTSGYHDEDDLDARVVRLPREASDLFPVGDLDADGLAELLVPVAIDPQPPGWLLVSP
jgi:hypothetical protein